MRIGLVSYQCKNRDTSFNMSQIEKAMRSSEGKADLLCFGEAFLQGVEALCWEYETAKDTVCKDASEVIPFDEDGYIVIFDHNLF